MQVMRRLVTDTELNAGSIGHVLQQRVSDSSTVRRQLGQQHFQTYVS